MNLQDQYDQNHHKAQRDQQAQRDQKVQKHLQMQRTATLGESDGKLSAQDITVIEKRSGIEILKDVDLTVERGEIVVLIGRSGSGKSTLANTFLGALRNELEVIRGSVAIGGSSPAGFHYSSSLNIADHSVNERYINMISYVMQNPVAALNPTMRIGKQVQEAVSLSAQASENKHDRDVARGLIDRAGLDPELIWNRYPHQLSIGMSQRVLIAIALAKPHSFLIADEPTSSLDTTASAQIKRLLKDLSLKETIGILLITHDLATAIDIADRIYLLRDGQIVEADTMSKIIREPKHPYTKMFVNAARKLWSHSASSHAQEYARSGQVTKDDLETKTNNIETVATDIEAKTSNIIDVKNISISYRRDENLFQIFGPKKVEVISDVSFTIKKGRICGLVGESGSGKTTLGRSLAGLIKPANDHIYINGKDLYGPNLNKNRSRRSVQMVFQDPFASLDPRETVRESLHEPLICLSGISRVNFDEKIKTTLEAVGLPMEILERRTLQLSEGQRQRLLIARSLVVEPEVLILDEPFTALDPILKLEMTELIMKIRSDLDLTILLISHDLSTIRSMADDVLVLYLGKVVESGPCGKVISAPLHPHTEALTSLMPTFSKRLSDDTYAGDETYIGDNKFTSDDKYIVEDAHLGTETHRGETNIAYDDRDQLGRRPVPDEVRDPIILSGELPSFIDIPPGCRFGPRCPLRQDECILREPRLLQFGRAAGHFKDPLSHRNTAQEFNSHTVACHFARPFPISNTFRTKQ